MKKLLALILALTMVFALVACGGETTTTEPTTEPATTTEPTTEPTAGFTPVEAEWENGKITVVGAEAFKDTDDKDAIRIYFDYENTTDETTYADEYLEIAVTQDGYEAVEAYAWDDVPEYNNVNLSLRPGAGIRCIAEFSMKADGGEITVDFQDYWSEESFLTAVFDPANLPGRPAEEFVIEPVAEPLWTDALPDEGMVDEDDGYYVLIDSAEVTEDTDGNPAIRVYFQFTNGSNEEVTMWFGTTTEVFQDGVELEETTAKDNPSQGIEFYEKVQPGETAIVSNTYALRSDSPVEVELQEGWGDAVVGCVFA